MMKRTTVQTKSQTFNTKDPVSAIAFLQDVTSTCDMFNVLEARWVTFSNITITAPSNPWSKRLLCYKMKRPRHKQGAWRRILRSLTIYWSSTHLTKTSQSLTPIFARSRKNCWQKRASYNNYGREGWCTGRCLPTRCSAGCLSRASTRRFIENFDNDGHNTGLSCLKAWHRKRNSSSNVAEINRTQSPSLTPSNPGAAGKREETEVAKLVTNESWTSNNPLNQDPLVDIRINQQ